MPKYYNRKRLDKGASVVIIKTKQHQKNRPYGAKEHKMTV
jgi:hypothetical protein